MESKRSNRSHAAGKDVVVHSPASIQALSQQVDALAQRLLCWSAVDFEEEAPTLALAWQALCSKHFRLCALRSAARIQKANKDAHDDDGDGFAGLDALPLHLQTAILVSLPLQKFVQLRAVCSSWNSLLQSPALNKCWSTLHAVEAAETADMWLVMSRACECPTLFKQFLAYSTSQCRLFPMPLDHPHVEAALGYRAARVPFGSWRCIGHNHCMPSLQHHPMMCASGAGGLLCCLQVTGSVSPETCARKDFTACWKHLPECLSICCESSVLVFNPLTGAVRYLPSLPNLSSTSSATQLSIHSQSGNHYYVVIRYCDRDGIWIFNSASGLWKYSLPHGERQYGPLSCLTEGDLFSWDCSDSWLHFYSLRRDVWSRVRMLKSCLENSWGSVRRVFKCATFLKCDKRILLAAQLRNKYYEPETSFGFAVWHLTIASQEVRATLLSFTPKNTLQKALVSTCECDPVRSRVTFTTNGTHICMTGDDHVVYDLVNDRWYRPPSNDGGFDYVGLSCFQPRLDADPYPPVSNKLSSAT